MIILPAIDIINGNCVRLYQGRYDTSEVVAENYLDTARSFEEAGAEWIHMVDLDGAKQGRPVNETIFTDVAKKTGLKVEVGGGIRTIENIEYYLDKGISRVILGSVALRDPELVKRAVDRFGKKIAVGIDAKGDNVSVSGWLEDSDVSYIDLAGEMTKAGVENIIYTDISKDGTLAGVSADRLDALNKAVSANIIASGGVRDISDIKKCLDMGLYGVIAGKSLYSGSLSLKESVKLAGGV